MDITEQPCRGRARHHAGRLSLGLWKGFIIDAVNAQRAFGHHLTVLIKLPDAVRTGPGAVLAANALVIVNQHNAIFLTLVRRSGRTHRDTGWILAMQTGLWKMYGLSAGINTGFISLYTVEEGPRWIGIIGVLIDQRTGSTGGIPLLAGSHAGMTANADIEIDGKG